MEAQEAEDAWAEACNREPDMAKRILTYIEVLEERGLIPEEGKDAGKATP